MALLTLASSGTPSLLQIALLVAYAALMMGVCMLACIVPSRRALRVEPTEALRAEGQGISSARYQVPRTKYE